MGKTSTCQILKNKLPSSVFLDGDWCWNMNPFIVTEETKRMVIDNICFLLNNYIKCSVYENIIFCWVMHEQSIIDTLLSRLNSGHALIHNISMICSPEALEDRLNKDIVAGIRTPKIRSRSLKKLPLYQTLNTRKIDVTNLTPEEVVASILCNNKYHKIKSIVI